MAGLALIACAWIAPFTARAQFVAPDKNSTHSVSGQFIVQGTPQLSALARSPRIAADNEPGPAQARPAYVSSPPERIGRFALARARNQAEQSVARANLFRAASGAFAGRRHHHHRPAVRRGLELPRRAARRFAAPDFHPGAGQRAAAGIRQPRRAIPFGGNSRVAHRRPVAADARHRAAGKYPVVAVQNCERHPGHTDQHQHQRHGHARRRPARAERFPRAHF